MASKKASTSGGAEKRVERTAKRYTKKLSGGQKIFLAAVLVIAIALGAGVGFLLTRGDQFTLDTHASLILQAGETVQITDTLCDVTAISFGKDLSASVTYTTTLPLSDDGSVTPDAGVYYTTYVMKTVYGKSVERVQIVTVVDSADAAEATEG